MKFKLITALVNDHQRCFIRPAGRCGIQHAAHSDANQRWSAAAMGIPLKLLSLILRHRRIIVSPVEPSLNWYFYRSILYQT